MVDEICITGPRVACPEAIKQLGLGLNLSTKKTRNREFLEAMEGVVPWPGRLQIVGPHCPSAKTGRPPFAVEKMVRIHYMQQWFGLSDLAMEEALHDVPHALMAGPGLDERAVNAEVLARQEPSLVGHLHRLVEQLGDRIVLDEPVSVLAEDGVVPHRVLDGQADEPTEQQVVVDLLDELPVAAHDVQNLQQHRRQNQTASLPRMPRQIRKPVQNNE